MADASTKAPEPPGPRELYATGTAAAGGAYLAGGRCESCGKACFPKRMLCRQCGSDQIADAMLGRRARVKTAAVVYNAPPGFVAPYVLALVEFEEGLVVMAPVVAWSGGEAPKAGTELELLVAPAKADGRAVAQYRIVDGAKRS